MARKIGTEATTATSPVVKKVVKRAPKAEVAVKAAAPRRKVTSKAVSESIANLVDAVEPMSALEINAREIEECAYQSWIERGCPMGSPEEDWYRAERELISRFATAAK